VFGNVVRSLRERILSDELRKNPLAERADHDGTKSTGKNPLAERADHDGTKSTGKNPLAERADHDGTKELVDMIGTS